MTRETFSPVATRQRRRRLVGRETAGRNVRTLDSERRKQMVFRKENGTFSEKNEGANAGEGSLLQIKITLKGIRPPIWRRFLVPEGLSLSDLHDVIQKVMGWWNSHLHQFVYRKKRYGMPDPDWDFDRIIDDSTVALKDLSLSPKDKILYEYDFGDGWEHELRVEKILPAEGRLSPVCLKGARACPPEDCGGSWGYASLLEAFKKSGRRGIRVLEGVASQEL